jgi:flagellar biosynthetic protein FliR
MIFSLISIRMAFLFVSAPLLSSRLIPMQIKAAIVVFISFITYLGLPAVVPPPVDVIGFLIAVPGEAAVGASAGITASIVFAAVEGGGRLMGIPMGLGFAQVVDPMTQGSTVVTARFLGVITSMMFLALNIHHVLFKLISTSFIVLPPGTVIPTVVSSKTLVDSASLIFIGSAQLVAPILIVLLGVLTALGILARVAPKINLFALSFAISIGLGLIALRGALPQMAVWLEHSLNTIEPLASGVIAGF